MLPYRFAAFLISSFIIVMLQGVTTNILEFLNQPYEFYSKKTRKDPVKKIFTRIWMGDETI